MTVAELIAILQKCDPSLPVATHANNHTFMSKIDGDFVRVALLDTYAGEHVVIGDLSKRNLNVPNWRVIEELDGGDALPDEWRDA